MNKRMLTTLGLSVILSIQCTYAEEIKSNINTEYQTNIDQDVSNQTGINSTYSKQESIVNQTVTDLLKDDKDLVSKQPIKDSQVLENVQGVEGKDFFAEQESQDIQNIPNTQQVPEAENTSTTEKVQNQEKQVTDSNEAFGISETEVEQVAASDLMNKVILKLNSDVAIVEGVEEKLLAPPTVINGTTLLPMRFVGEKIIGAQIDWDSATKTVTMTKGDNIVSVTIGSKIAVVNGEEKELLVAPIIQNNSTLVPVRFFSENFNIKVDYDSTTKVITLEKEVIAPTPGEGGIIEGQAPIASFYFVEQYVAGQVVEVVNTSTDPDGDQIVDELWSVVGEKTVTNKKLSEIFRKPKAGEYTIGLQVQDSRGLWSEWTYQTVTILPNQAPVITSLAPSKTSYAQGEPIGPLTYTYENESWETVKEGKWTYRKADDVSNRATLGCPEVLFTEGDYIVTLYLDDEYGNRSAGYETIIHISSQVNDTELNYKFSNNKIGDWIDNFGGFNYLQYTQANVLQKNYIDGTLIMSDSPEEVKGKGILYKDSINGVGRLLIHHINKVDSMEKQRLALIVENPTEQPVNVTLKNKTIKGPATDVLRVGQLCLNEYLSGAIPPETITLQPGEKKYIYEKNWNIETCISAHIDVETTGEARFIVADLEPTDTLENLDSLVYYQPDGVHISGTYDKMGIQYTLNLAGNQPERLTLGVANSGEWVVGYDARTGQRVENAGNFGVSYYITVTANEDMGVILNNRGGSFQGAVKWNDIVYNMPGKGTFSGTTTKAVVLGVVKKGETVTIEYILPNGSAAPTLIGFIPKTIW